MRLYTFNLSDGSIKVLTIDEALKIQDPLIKRRIEEIIQNSKQKRMVKDGFQAGYQENIQAYVGGRREYDKALRDRGLVEIGKDYVPKEAQIDYNPCASDEFVQGALEAGVHLSGNEQEAIKSGEYFKD